MKKGVKAAYLFGSQKEAGVAFLKNAILHIDKEADLDIGVVFERLPGDVFDTYGELYAELSVFFDPFNIDLVFLQETDPFFQYEAILGELICCDDESFIDEYEEKVMKVASDLSFKKAESEKDFIEAVKNGYFEITR